MSNIKYTKHNGSLVPVIAGAKGSKGSASVAPNNLFSSDVLYLTIALGEGPLYRINPNGPQDIEIQDGAIDDLINLSGNGKENTDKFLTISSSGTITQDPLPLFGNDVVSPQAFASPVVLKKGNIDGIPESKVTLQETSAASWDALLFNFIIDELAITSTSGAVKTNSVSYNITLYTIPDNNVILSKDYTVSGKTDVPFKFTNRITIPDNYKSDSGYRFSISKTSDDSDDAKNRCSIKIIGWDEVESTKLAYPRTALIGYAIKAANEHTGGIPNFTSMAKGLLVKVPSNYNQPILENGDIDWRQLEVAESGSLGYTTTGYRLQKSGTSTTLTSINPQIYVGTWDGSFVYSWTQNPVWIVYDILTNKTYGLGIPEENIDKYKFYQVAMYCDACETSTGKFIGVDAVADGSYRYKPRNYKTAVKEVLVGLPKGTPVKERRFITDLSISDQERAMDILNKITSTFRAILVYAGGKVSLAVDMPDEYPVMLFTDANIKQGSFQISGVKESEIFTGVDVSYIEPTNHFKREVVRIDRADANDGSEVLATENITTLDLTGVTRRSQAIRLAQYQMAAAKYLRRNITFITSTEALSLAPGDVISVATNSTGVSYGYGGKVTATSATADASNTNVYIEHFTVPSLSTSTFTANSNPLALRVVSLENERMELYLISNTVYSLSASNVSNGYDNAVVKAISRYNPLSKTFTALSTGFSASSNPVKGDIWSIGEIENPNNYYTNKSGKLFKVTGVTRGKDDTEVTVNGIEYIPNVYIDSDTFINYEPTAYVDTTSPFSTPPTPLFSFTTATRRQIDGSITVDGILQNKTEKIGYNQQFEAEYYIATTQSEPISNVTASSPLTFLANTTPLANGMTATITGKNGFHSPIGSIKLLCTNISTTTPGSIKLTLAGLSRCYDYNFNMHVLEVNDGSIPSLKGTDQITLPVHEKSGEFSQINFIGYSPSTSLVSRDIVSVDLANETVTIADTVAGAATLASSLTDTPFYVTINQILAKDYYTANTFYVSGTEATHILTGSIDTSTVTINLPVKPRNIAFTRLFVDGVLKSSGQYTLNKNELLSLSANIQYTRSSASESAYRVELDHYTVPAIEVGDTIEVNYGNTFTVINSSYDTSSAKFNTQLTANCIYRVELAERPSFDLAGFDFLNITQNPAGIINNVHTGSATLDYNVDAYPGSIHLANSYIYELDYAPTYERLYLGQDLTIKDLPIGTTTVKARNRNRLGRLSPFVQQSATVEAIPIQKVQNIALRESLYIEQLGGVAIRLTCEFDHIVGQEVTDYEISYKLSGVTASAEDYGTALTSYNTVKIPAEGVDSDGKMRFTINNINRGSTGNANSITIRITPLNKSIRGITATKSQPIIGKTAAPQNIYNFAGGQQNELVTLYWDFVRVGSELYDLDLQEVVIRRIAGTVDANIENFLAAQPLVVVSTPSQRKSIPIDSFGTYTYLARTKDTSGNFSDSVIGTTVTTIRAQRTTTIRAYSEDNPSVTFSAIPNTNSSEYYFPSRANSTGGLSGPGKSAVDNANGSSSGYSVTIDATDILAVTNATYITQIRDIGSVVVGQVIADIQYDQELQGTYNDTHEETFGGLVSETSSSSNVLFDTAGIGTWLGYANANVATGRYDANNRTWMTGPDNGNVWAVWNHGQFAGDTANANSYALIAGLINANAVALGATYYANGKATGSNALANVTTIPSSYTIVNMTQYSDVGGTTYAGTLGAIQAQTFIRTSTDSPYFANGKVNTLVFSSTSDGFLPYEVGTKRFRYFQLKHIITNNKPDEYDVKLNKLRYTVDKEQTIYANTVTYSSSPTTVDFTASAFLNVPVVTFAVKDQKDSLSNPAIVVTTALSNTSISFKLIASNGTGEYNANSTANIMITATGV